MKCFLILPDSLSFVKLFFNFFRSFSCSDSLNLNFSKLFVRFRWSIGQPIYNTTARSLCQQLFSLSDLPPPRLQISFSVVSRYPIVYSSHSLAVPPPRLQKSVPVFRIAVISDKWYPIMYGSNCQCFSCFLFISDNSNNYPFYRFFSVINIAFKILIQNPLTETLPLADLSFAI